MAKRGARQRGFSLIELMFVVAIIGVIAMVAVPAYTKQIQKNQRAVAKARLAQAAQLLERFYSDNNSYFVDASGGNLTVSTTNSTVAGFALLMRVPSGTTVYSGSNNETTSAYTITLATATANNYVLTATVVPTNAQSADLCGNLTLTNTGVKGVTGTDPNAATVPNCW